jgi:N-formylglutamate amidohydrolase
LEHHTLASISNSLAENDINSVFELDRPTVQTMPFVFACPHSGTIYTDSFIKTSRLDQLTLRRSEDSFVDDLYADAANFGAPLLKALFPRAYVDLNREAYELDQKMFKEKLPKFVNTNSPRAAAGLGTIPRFVTNSDEIYKGKISFKEVESRIKFCYLPYHAKLQSLIDETKLKFKKCILIDCHSMPSTVNEQNSSKNNQHVDVVLGNKYGKTCAPELIEFVECHLKHLGLIVHRNHPYAGGYTTQYYGNPVSGTHALQIEINRGIYMDEKKISRNNEFGQLKNKVSSLIKALKKTSFTF